MNWLRNHWLGMLLIVVISGAVFLVMRPENTQKPTSQTVAVKKSPAGDEDPMAELQKLLSQPSKPAWRVSLENYWPFGAGIGVFLGLVLVIVKLLRKKPSADDESATPDREGESEDESEEGDEKPRQPTFTTAPDEDRSRSHRRIAGWVGGGICILCVLWISASTILSVGRLEKLVTELQTTKANKSEVATKENIRSAVLEGERNTFNSINENLVAPLREDVAKLKTGVAGLTTKVEQYKKTVSTFDRRLTATGASVVKLTDRLTKFRSEATSSISANSARLDALVAGEARRDSIVSAKMSELDSLIQWTSELNKGR